MAAWRPSSGNWAPLEPAARQAHERSFSWRTAMHSRPAARILCPFAARLAVARFGSQSHLFMASVNRSFLKAEMLLVAHLEAVRTAARPGVPRQLRGRSSRIELCEPHITASRYNEKRPSTTGSKKRPYRRTTASGEGVVTCLRSQRLERASNTQQSHRSGLRPAARYSARSCATMHGAT